MDKILRFGDSGAAPHTPLFLRRGRNDKVASHSFLFLRKGKTFILSLAFACMLGCCATPSKQGTALDHIKKDLKQASLDNKNLKPIQLPTAVEDSLKPQLAIINDTNSNLTHPEQKFNVIADNVPASAFFLGLVEDTDINLTLHPKLSGTISVKLKNVNVTDVLEAVQRVYGYGIEIENNSIKILPAALQTRTFKVNYLDIVRDGSSETKINSSGLDSASSGSSSGQGQSGSTGSSSGSNSSNNSSNSSNGAASATVNSKINTTSSVNFWTKLETTLKAIIGNEDGRKVAVIPVTGMVIVQAMPDELIRVEKFLKQSELFLNRQVILETKILEVELNDAYRAGINWATLGRHLNASQLGGNMHDGNDISTTLPITASSVGGTTGNASTVALGTDKTTPLGIARNASPFGGIFTLGFNYRSLTTFVELLGSQGNVQVLSSPRISTTNNQKALIKVGSDEFFVTDVSTSTTTVAGAAPVTSPTVKFNPFFSGIALDVTPQIEEDGHVTLHVHPTISTVIDKNKDITIQGKTDTYPLAVNTVRESDSIIRAKNGQFVVIGGLMQDKTGEVVSGVPLLKDIPFLGKAFRHTRQQAKKTELVILLRPLVMNDQAWNNELEESFEKFDKLDQGFHLGGNPKLYGTMAEKIRK
jgi:MSHA biogenesis protein MshL